MPTPKPCDTHANLPCTQFGKCYGYAWQGKTGTAKELHSVRECPFREQVRDWWRKNVRR